MDEFFEWLEEVLNVPTERNARRWRERTGRRLDEARARHERELNARHRQPHQWRVAFLPGNRIAEFRDGQRRRSLWFPTGDGRDHYRKGDIILLRAYTRTWLGRIFPELAQKEDGISLMDILSMCLGIKEKKYKVGYQIEELITENPAHGTGRVGLRAVLFVPELDQFIKIEGHNSYRRANRDQLSGMFEDQGVFEALDLLNSAAEFVVKNLPLGQTFGVRQAARFIFRRAGRKVLAKIRNRLIRKLIAFLLKAFPRKFVPRFFKKLAEKSYQLQQDRSFQQQLGIAARKQRFRQVVINAAREAALDTIDDLLSDKLMKKITASMEAIFPDARDFLEKKVFGYLSDRIVHIGFFPLEAIVEEGLAWLTGDRPPGQSTLRERFSKRFDKDLSSDGLWKAVFDDLGKVVKESI